MYPYSGFGANPYAYGGMNNIPQYQPQQPQLQQTVLRVNGENGARTLSLAPRCSALALDESAAIVWLITSDDAGYKTVKPYSISEYHPEPQPDMQSICDRLSRLEARVNESYPEYVGQSAERSGKRAANVSGIQSGKRSERVYQSDHAEEPDPSADRG